jgi:hypothetical protein
VSRLLDVSTRRAGGALRPEKLQGSKGHIQQSRWDPGRARLFGTTLLFSSDQPGTAPKPPRKRRLGAWRRSFIESPPGEPALSGRGGPPHGAPGGLDSGTHNMNDRGSAAPARPGAPGGAHQPGPQGCEACPLA